jgi:hypothetical protein
MTGWDKSENIPVIIFMCLVLVIMLPCALCCATNRSKYKPIGGNTATTHHSHHHSHHHSLHSIKCSKSVDTRDKGFQRTLREYNRTHPQEQSLNRLPHIPHHSRGHSHDNNNRSSNSIHTLDTRLIDSIKVKHDREKKAVEHTHATHTIIPQLLPQSLPHSLPHDAVIIVEDV